LLAAGQTQHIIVIDAGNTGFRISCVERKDNGEMIVIDNQNVLVGHDIDTILLNWIISHFPLHPDEQILREIEVFVQDFKVQMSRSFSNGKPDHNQFCVVGGLSSPLLLVINRDEFEQMVSQSIQQLSDAIRESPARVGLGCENISYVLVAGGSANWFFLSKLIQENLKQTPFKESRPEETIVKGLTLYGLTR
jgi:molecular chaperone DnaK (HSP70)